jgi:HD-GYP domain-containing protein (c-di-GMP phosphodiesterase class II)
MTNPGQKFFKVRLASMHPDRPLTFDLYIYLDDHHLLYLREGHVFAGKQLEHFLSHKADQFYVRYEDREKYKNYLRDRVHDEGLTPAERGLILKESSFSLVEELFENPRVDEALEESKFVISNFVDFIDAEPDAVASLIGLSSHDFYTYNHSLDVCVYSLGLGQKVGYSSKQDLIDLGRGALFHDIGKRKVPVEIITKQGTLNEAEWLQMKRHPLYGLQLLNDFPDISESIKACVFEHHENHIGNGYPQGLKGKEIHPMAGIVAIADTYDAMTTKRSYNAPMTPHDALTLMRDKIAGRFDPELLRIMYSVLFKEV